MTIPNPVPAPLPVTTPPPFPTPNPVPVSGQPATGQLPTGWAYVDATNTTATAPDGSTATGAVLQFILSAGGASNTTKLDADVLTLTSAIATLQSTIAAQPFPGPSPFPTPAPGPGPLPVPTPQPFPTPNPTPAGGHLPAVGRIVHYVMNGDAASVGKVRPAIIVRNDDLTNAQAALNLQVFTDSTNDGPAFAAGIVWHGSVPFDGSATPAAGSWHWPPHV